MRFAKHIGAICTVFFALSGLSVASAAPRARNEATLLGAMNQVRAAYGLSPLRADAVLARAAHAHSVDELRHGYFGHGAWTSRLARFGVRGRAVGENLAWGSGPLGSATAIVQAWLASPEHRTNLLDPGFTRVGLAMPAGSFNGQGGVLMTTADFSS